MADVPSAAASPSAAPPPRADSHRLSAASQLPRIRASRFSSAEASPSDNRTTYDDDMLAAGSSVATGVADDVVSPLSPTASDAQLQPPQRPGTNDVRNSTTATGTTPDTSRPLLRLLGRVDVAEQCRWSGLLLIVFYGITVLLWPSLFVSAMGFLCGLSGSWACVEPYTIQKIVWVFVYAYLNVAMLGALAWTALDQLVLRGSEAASVNYLYMGAFILIGLIIHVRSFQTARVLIVKCKLTPILVEAVVPERWRPVPQPPVEGETSSLENIDNEETSLHDRRSSSSSVHSFDIDIQSPRSHYGRSRTHSPEARVAAAGQSSPPSTPRSGPVSPITTQFRRLDDPCT